MSLVLAETGSPEEVIQEQAAVQTSTPAAKGTYGQILKSSAIVGGSSLINIGVGIVRTKLMALLLGPVGFGTLSMYSSTVTLAQTVAGMGVNSSGVRQIAEAASTGDDLRIGQTSAILRRLSLLLGVVGGLLIVFLAPQISELSFGTRSHSAQMRELGAAVLLAIVSGGQGALINGMRRIGDLARMSVIGAVTGTILSVPIIYFLRERGIAPSLVVVSLMTCLASWWYSRKIEIPRVPSDSTVLLQEASSLLKLGFAFMASGLMTVGVAYTVRILVARKVGLEATGLYQSAWTLGGLYVGFILQAMGADFYPRLTACAKDDPACNRLVNEQAHVGLLLGGPGVLGTLTFAPVIIALFYTSRFGPAVNVLRWICLGTLLQVVTWPMGFIIVAKARQTLFVVCEVAWSIVSLLLAWVCITRYGVVGAGLAFFGSYIFHGFLIYGVVRKVSGYRWSEENRTTAGLFTAVIACVFSGFYLLPLVWAVAFGTLATLAAGAYSIRRLTRLVASDPVPKPIRHLLSRLHGATRPSASF